jgi:hypothetical protein
LHSSSKKLRRPLYLTAYLLAPHSIYLINQRCADREQAGRSPGATAEKAVHQTGAIMTMRHLLTIVIAMLQEQLFWHDRHVAIHSLFAQAEKTKRG